MTIPDSVTEIDLFAFYNCAGLTDVYYTGTQAQWESIAIDRTRNGNDPLLNAAIHCDYEIPPYVAPEEPEGSKEPEEPKGPEEPEDKGNQDNRSDRTDTGGFPIVPIAVAIIVAAVGGAVVLTKKKKS